uniref:Crystaline entomocidal protoxin n=1 Tax=Bacillus thuringiensis TaxID=1428 RepID=M1E9Q8_BACTU|nr:Cry7Ba1-like protein [Bacillus thuringiensis]
MNCGNHNEFDSIDETENNQTTTSRYVNVTNKVTKQGNSSNKILSNLSSNYPLASNPNTPFQNMNYKEYLNIIEGNTVISPTVGVASALTAGVTILNKILGTLLKKFAGKILVNIFKLLWPTAETDDVWEDFMEEVEILIDQKIEAYAKSRALTDLVSIGNAVERYQTALEDWEKQPENLKSLGLVIQRYNEAESHARNSMPLFAVGGFEVPLLATYVNAANVHLLLMRDMQLYGNQWGIPQSDIDLYQREQEKYTDEYTNYCVKWYEEGLKLLDPRENSSLQSFAYQWEFYNRYRREMTLMVLDLISVFPSYNAVLYPIGTTVKITREVYTDVMAYDEWYPEEVVSSFTDFESILIRPPHLYDLLERIDFYTNVQGDSYRWAGHKITYKRGPYETAHTKSYGDTAGTPTDIYFGYSDVVSTITKATRTVYGVVKSTFYQVNGEKREYDANSVGNYREAIYDSNNELPLGTSGNLDDDRSHKLCHAVLYKKDKSPTAYVIYSWTHASAGRINEVFGDKISQLPAVKMYDLGGSTTVVKGPKFTGGDLVKRKASSGGGVLGYYKCNVASSDAQKYRLRIRYCSDFSGIFRMQVNGVETIQADYSSTRDSTSTMSSESFKFREFTTTFELSEGTPSIMVALGSIYGEGEFYLDRIEFIPVDVNYDERVTLEKAQKSVNALFTAGRNALQTDMTDFKVDQVSILVDCVSGELYPNEKRELLSLVKYAKRLSYSRNLLLDPTLDSINSSEENGWYGSNGITIGNGDFVFKGNYLIFSGTNDTQYPTYLYQKIDESKLKEYTRYKLRGFIESSQDLEAYVIRYDAKHQTMDVSNNLLPDTSPVNACGEPNRCAGLQYLDENPRLECSSIQDGILSDSHSFSLNIDTGSIDLNENIGIWVLFKISTSEGYAKFGNLEVIEDSPVIGEALARVKRKETKWRNKLAQLRTETQAIYTRAKQALDNLFANAQDSHLKIGTTFATIVSVREIVQSIREAYMSWLSVVPGVNYPIFTELNERVQQAFQLYDVRNVVRNGRFLNGISDWIVTSDVRVQEENGNNVLVLSNWDAQVLQCLKLYQDRGYILRVTARKIGLGEGYITITDEEGHTDQLTFGSCESIDSSNSLVSTGYITKELEFFPDTEKVHIEIGETEGTFQVESVELFLMEDLC